jgi:hypothetical protein
MGTLIVCAALGNSLGTGTQAGERHDDAEASPSLAMTDLAEETDLIVHQAAHVVDRCRFLHEIGKTHLDMAGFGFQAIHHLPQDILERFHANLAIAAVEDFDEARHMGALEFMRQAHGHVEADDGVLFALAAVPDPHRVQKVLDADLVYGNPAGVGAALNVVEGGGENKSIHFWRSLSPGQCQRIEFGSAFPPKAALSSAARRSRGPAVINTNRPRWSSDGRTGRDAGG